MKRIEFGEFHSNDIMKDNLLDCLKSNWITMGPKVKQLEEKFAQKFGYKYVVGTSSGTTADTISLISLYDYGAQPGDEIICPGLAFIAVGNAIRSAGFVPKFVDIKKETLNIDETLIEAAISDKTRAIIAVNTMGKPCKMEVIRNICDKHQLKLIVDNCEAHWCKRQGKLMSEYGDICTYSGFTAHVVMSAEFGFCGTNSEELYDILRSIRSHGRKPDSHFFSHDRFGINAKPTDLHASIGLGSLAELNRTFGARDNNLRSIRARCAFLRDVCWFSEEDGGDFNCPHGFSLTCKQPEYFDKLTLMLDNYNIHWKLNFGEISQHGAFKYLGCESLPNSNWVGKYGLHIGCHPYLNVEDIDQIVVCLHEFYRSVK